MLEATQKSSMFHVFSSAVKMAVATFSSRILGLVREQVIAAMFGASGLTDAFFVAYRIPNLLRDLFAEGAFSSAFVPVFTEIRHRDPQAARRLMWSLFILLGGITALISLLMIIFAPQLITLFAPKFVEVPDKFELAVNMTKIMAPFLVLVSLAALFMGVLNSLKMFFMPALAPAFYNIVMILSMVLMPSWLSKYQIDGIYALGIGVILGGSIQMLIQVPLIMIKKYGPLGPVKLISVHTKKIINRISIGTIGIAATQINLLVTTILATGTMVGAVTWLNYAFRLFQFPVGILSVSIAGSNLVHFSDAWKSDDHVRAKECLASSYFLALVTIIPAFALLYAMSLPAVHLIFERGKFIFQDTQMTSLAMRYYLLGLPFYGLYKLFAPTFYALDMPKVPVTVSVISIVFNIIFCLIMTPLYGFKILALGTSLSMCLNTSAQGFFLFRYLKLSPAFFLNVRIVKVISAGVLCFFICDFLIANYFYLTADFFSKLLQFCVIGLIGLVGYLVILIILGEWKFLIKIINRKNSL